MKISYEKDEIVIRIPCGAAIVKKAKPSKSGKTVVIASTGGFAQVEGAPDGIKLNLNLTAPKGE